MVLAISLPIGAVHAADEPLMEVSGRLLSVNGTTAVPLGMFGVHATPLDAARIADWGVTALRVILREPSGIPLVSGEGKTPAGLAQIVECFYDRFQPAKMLTDAQWKKSLTDLARRYGIATAHDTQSGLTHHVEFWNEPYLNWSCKPGVNYDSTYYDTTIPPVVGGRVTIKGQAQPTEFLQWSRGVRAVDALTGDTDYVAAGRAPAGAKAGDTYQFRGRAFRVEDAWVAKDPTQHYYWAGKQNSLWYRQLFVPFAQALKAADPKVQISAGWGFNMWNEEWAAWRQLYQPLIDEALPLMDGLHEHHYGGETRLVAASYEVATAYTAERGKRLHFYNTEAGGMLDPEKPDTPSSAVSGTPLQRAQGAMTYFLRDVIHLLDVCPDKAFARAAHESDQNGGDEFAFKLLKPLRGELIACRSTSSERWVIASLHDQTLAVVCFNDERRAIQAPLRVHAPTGMRLAAARVLGVITRPDGQGLALTDEVLAGVDGTSWSGVIDMPMKAARTVVFTLRGTLKKGSTSTVTQIFSPGILATVTPAEPLIRKFIFPQALLKAASRARLKMVILDHDGKGSISVNGNIQPLRRGSCTVYQEVDVAWLKAVTTVTFSALSEKGSAYRVLMASIDVIVESP